VPASWVGRWCPIGEPPPVRHYCYRYVQYKSTYSSGTQYSVRGLRAEFYPRILRKYKVGVCEVVACLYQLVRINFYDKLSGQSKCSDFRFGAFCFLYEAYPPTSTGDFLTNQNVNVKNY